TDVAATAAASGLRTRGVVASPLPGPSGNVEYFLWLRKDVPGPGDTDIDLGGIADLVRRAVEEGPQ
ncbi:MAG: 16S/23S rRNA (cytidine-2'-O)-methyltransferase, partial [Nocardia sp.]|nr:16S/23S rRNA (cytidine-2'-O)-methyltransferase [Nocardia sp.]